MTEARKESLSALIDGEASEIEVHRLIREFRGDETLVGSWSVYQQIRAVVRSSETIHLDHQDLRGRISFAIEAEEHHAEPAPRQNATRLVAGSLALAASLTLAVLITVQEVTIQNPADDPGLAQRAPLAVQTVANRQAEQVTPELVELDEEKQRRLRAYLNQHDQMARMKSNSQLVNYKKGTAPGSNPGK